ncbi:CCA tRNA nucleotidyltransferase [Patescibacteria group bacterium]|nr:CCA tRNA nucleotidyltransferase [Patescibacteria group bacterium]
MSETQNLTQNLQEQGKPDILIPDKQIKVEGSTQLWLYTKQYGETEVFLQPGFGQEVNRIEGEYKMEVPDSVMRICHKVKSLGGRALVVGGSVKEMVMSQEFDDYDVEPKDYDLEVYGLSEEHVTAILEDMYGEVTRDENDEGYAYPVLKVDVKGLAYPIEVGLPRRETKTGDKRGDFKFEVDPAMSISEASFRRATTMEALLYDPLTETVYDPYNGVEHIKNRTIEIIDEKAFREDPIRVLRVMQAMSRSEFQVSETTLKVCKEMVSSGELDTLSKGSIKGEMEKLLVKGKKPSIGLEFAREIGIVEKYWPELHALIGVEQNGEAHPEGDVWRHTMQTVDVAALIVDREIEGGRIPPQEVFEQFVNNARCVRDSSYNGIYIDRVSKYLMELDASEAGEVMIMRELASNTRKAHYEDTKRSMTASRKHAGRPNYVEAMALARATKFEQAKMHKLLSTRLDVLRASGKLSENDIKELEENIDAEADSVERVALAELVSESQDEARLVLTLAALGHDTGKPEASVFEDGEWKTDGHELVGVPKTAAFLDHFEFSKRVRNQVLTLIPHHLSPKYYWEQERDLKLSRVRVTSGLAELCRNLEAGDTSIYMLSLLAEAEQRGRNPDQNTMEPLEEEQASDLKERQEWLVKRTEGITASNNSGDRLLTGGDLLGKFSDRKPGPWIKSVLAAVSGEQAEGHVKDIRQALDSARRNLERFTEIVEQVAQAEHVSEIVVWEQLCRYPDPRVVFENRDGGAELGYNTLIYADTN